MLRRTPAILTGRGWSIYSGGDWFFYPAFPIAYKSYSEQYIDSSGIFKDVIIALLSTLAKQERIRISERVKTGLEKSRQQGRIGGRPTLDETKIKKIQKLKSSGMSIMAIAKELKISRGSVYQYLV